MQRSCLKNLSESVRVLRNIFIFSLIMLCFTGSRTAFSQAQIQLETAQLAATEQLAHDLFEAGKAAHDGVNRPQDFEDARALYLEAADLGSTPALLNLGYLYFTGQGVQPDYVKAREYYEIAAKRGSEDAKENIKMMDARGLGLLPSTDSNIPNTVQSPLKEAISTTDLTPNKPEAQFLEDTPSAAVSPEPLIMSPKQNTHITELKPNASTTRSNKTTAILIGLATPVFLVLYIIALKHNRDRKIRKQFIELFYEAKRNQLRKLYLHRYDNGFVEAKFYKEWHATLTALMARYALNFDGDDEDMRMFCDKLNHGLRQQLRPTQSLASDYSHEMMQASLSDIKAVDAFHMDHTLEETLEFVSRKALSQDTPKFHDNIVNLFKRKSIAQNNSAGFS